MRSRRRFRPTILATVLATGLVLAGCGVEAGDSAAPATTSSSTTTSTTDGPGSVTEPASPIDDELRDQLIEIYVNLGFTEEEARCVADAVSGDDGTLGADPMVGGMDIINECGISASRLMELGRSMGGGSVEDAFRRSLIEGMVVSGADRADAECVADGYIDEFGADPSPSTDEELMRPLFEDCGLDP